MLIVVAGKLQYGDVPKRLKGPHSKCGRSGNRRKGSNPFISANRSLAVDLVRRKKTSPAGEVFFSAHGQGKGRLPKPGIKLISKLPAQ